MLQKAREVARQLPMVRSSRLEVLALLPAPCRRYRNHDAARMVTLPWKVAPAETTPFIAVGWKARD